MKMAMMQVGHMDVFMTHRWVFMDMNMPVWRKLIPMMRMVTVLMLVKMGMPLRAMLVRVYMLFAKQENNRNDQQTESNNMQGFQLFS